MMTPPLKYQDLIDDLMDPMKNKEIDYSWRLQCAATLALCLEIRESRIELSRFMNELLAVQKRRA